MCRLDRIFLALDAVTDPATGNIVCNASLPPNSEYKDCKPLNLFGREATRPRKPSTG